MHKAKAGSPAIRALGVPDASLLDVLLQESGARHQHLCPRQVLGVRLGLYGLRLLGFADESYGPRFANQNKRLLVIVETDGCGADGLAVATGCRVGQRTLRVLDIGKLAATLVDTVTSKAIRLAPAHDSRTLACEMIPDAESRWHAYLEAYQFIPDSQLFSVQEVELVRSIEEILSKPEAHALCEMCGEEIVNAREIYRDNQVLCRTCAGETYYQVVK